MENCKVDACVGANGNAADIPAQVADAVTNPIETVCNDPDLGNGGEAPPPALECPSGSIQVGYNGGEANDIGGSGLDTNRYNQGSIDDCELKCQKNKDCAAFSYNPIGGDRAYPDVTVCSLYNSAVPTNTHGPNQIFCKIVPRTCTMKLYTMVDDNQKVYKKVGSGSYGEIASKNGWGQPITTTVGSVTADTMIAVEVVNTGGPGGFMSKVVVTNDATGNSVTRRTTNPIGNTFDVYNSGLNGGSDITNNVGYFNLGQQWGSITSASRPDYAGCQWVDVGSSNSGVTTYTFYYNNLAQDMADVGCISRSQLHEIKQARKDTDKQLFEFEQTEKVNNSYYIESFGMVGLVLLLCGMGLYYRQRNNKLDDIYQPLKGIDSSEMNPFLKEDKIQV